MKNTLIRIAYITVIIAGTLIPSEKATSSLEIKSLENLTTQSIDIDFLNPVMHQIGVKRTLEMAEKMLMTPHTYKTDDFYKDTDEMLLARMLLGETEDCSEIEKIAVAYTAINRTNDGKKWNGETLQEVILKPYQYSAFNENLNAKLKNPMTYNLNEFEICLELAKEILAGKYSDPTKGATHYLNPNHPDLKGKPLPSWTNSMEKIGRIENSYHVFYKEI